MMSIFHSEIPKTDHNHELVVQVARLLNESDVYQCTFVASQGKLLSMHDYSEGGFEGGGYYYDSWSCIHGLLENIHGTYHRPGKLERLAVKYRFLEQINRKLNEKSASLWDDFERVVRERDEARRAIIHMEVERCKSEA